MRNNRLAQETSPYLLQHAHNPVDWYAWGPEAFERARREDKPIFLSVGYSTCYWCHVMERQSFEIEAVAAVMNEHFVCIKVDREERPDVDQLYMTGVQVQTRRGGWPMSAFLTPDLQYFYGGTYFPPQDAHGRPGFVTLLRGIHDAWKNRRDEVMRSARHFTQILRQLSVTAKPQAAIEIGAADIAKLVLRSIDDFDVVDGGYGDAPKFPRETLLELLLASIAEKSSILHTIENQRSTIENQLIGTLDAMMYGGIRDQLGGGFHRYSTDAQWLVPHFEIMLYDNAMLGWIYAEASRRFEHDRYAVVARELFDFVLREMTSPQGGFYTAIDAEVDAQEGMPYLWLPEQIRRTLTDEMGKEMGAPFSNDQAALFMQVFGIDRGFNFADPHQGSGTPDKNILFVSDVVVYHENFDLLKRMRWTLLQERDKRKQPLLDTKIITSWNALMIRALAHAGACLDEPRYTHAAAEAADYLVKKHMKPDGTIIRTQRDGVGNYAGFIDDYAFLTDALLTLHDATGEQKWRTNAQAVADQMVRRFEDASDGGFFFTDAAADDLIVRQKSATDSPLPSGNAIAARVLIKLGQTDAARRTLGGFAEQTHQQAEAMSSMLHAMIDYLKRVPTLRVEPSPLQSPLSTRAPDAAKIVEATVQRLGDGQIELMLIIADGWHINANPAGDRLLPTEVRVAADPEARVTYPPTEFMQPSPDRPAVPIYRGTVRFVIESTARTGDLAVLYQPCDDARCLAAGKFKIPIPG